MRFVVVSTVVNLKATVEVLSMAFVVVSVWDLNGILIVPNFCLFKV